MKRTRSFLPVMSLLGGMFPVSAQVVINEVCSRNATVWEAPGGGHPDWIELYNAGTAPVHLQQFFLSDKPGDPGLWQLPAQLLGPGEYAVLFSGGGAGGFPFGIDGEGETITLSDASLNTVRSLHVPRLDMDHSYGAAGPGLRYFATPTPGAANTTTAYLGYAPAPLFDRAPGHTQQGSQVSVGAAGGSTVRWTWNGRQPDEGSPIASGALTIDSTMVLQARTYLDHWLPSPTTVATYVVNGRRKLPIVSLSVDPDSMFHPELGLYMAGPGADTLWPHYGANYWADRSLPAYMEFFEPNGARGLVQRVDVKIHGGRRSRTNPQRPLRLTARAKYGDDVMRYPFFPERPDVDRFHTLVLRNSGGDFCLSNFRDGLFHQISLHNGLDVDELAFRPATAYVNGKYWGLVEMRERIDEQHLHHNYGADEDSVLMMEEENWSMQGDTIHFWELMQFIHTQDLNDPANWRHVDSLLDIHSVKDYFALEMQAGNVDWPSNNLKYWKPSVTEGKWRYILYDLDATMRLYGWIPEDLDMFHWTFVHRAGFVHSELFRGLMGNHEFKRTFLNRLADLMNTALSAERFQAEIDKVTDAYDGEIEQHFDRWDCWYQVYLDHAFGIIPHFAQARDAYVRQHVLDHFGFPNAPRVAFDVFPPAAGSILINTITPELPFNGYYFNGNDIDVTALPHEGLVFDHWSYSEDEGTTTDPHWKRSFPADGRVTAHFRNASGALTAFPNPTTGDLTLGIEADSDGPARVTVTDITGRVLATYSYTVKAGVGPVRIDIGLLRAGMLLVTTEVNGDRRSAKVLKQ